MAQRSHGEQPTATTNPVRTVARAGIASFCEAIRVRGFVHGHFWLPGERTNMAEAWEWEQLGRKLLLSCVAMRTP